MARRATRRKLITLDRNDPAAKALLGTLLIDLGRTADAVACLGEAVANEPRDIAFRETLAQALAADGDPDSALAVLLEGIALVPGATATRNAAVLLCIRRRDFARAEHLAEQARIDGVADASTFGLKGHALSSLGRHDEAALAYNEALKLAPGRSLRAPPRRRRWHRVRRRARPTNTCAPCSMAMRTDSDLHLVALGYRIPGLIRRHVIDFASLANIGPILDLGCGTGLVALALSDLDLGPFFGIDLSAAMLEEARAKELYASLRERPRSPDALREDPTTWRLIVAAGPSALFLAPWRRCSKRSTTV